MLNYAWAICLILFVNINIKNINKKRMKKYYLFLFLFIGIVVIVDKIIIGNFVINFNQVVDLLFGYLVLIFHIFVLCEIARVSYFLGQVRGGFGRHFFSLFFWMFFAFYVQKTLYILIMNNKKLS